MASRRVLGIVLAGAAGKRLAPLTEDRAKSAVPFGGLYRLVDFALSNLVNAGIRKICVLTQYKSHSLDRHITTTWQLNSLLGNYVAPVPAQQRLGPRWQTGSADAIYQSLNLIRSERPDLVVVFGADDVYRMDPAQMIEAHLAWGAGVTVAAIRVPRASAASFGVVQPRTATGSRRSWRSPLRRPPCRAGRTRRSRPWATTCSTARCWWIRCGQTPPTRAVSTASAPTSCRCWRGQGAAHVYDFLQNEVPGTGGQDHGYWREVGTLDSYFAAHMDLCAPHPVFSLYNEHWPILTHVPPQPPAKFVLDDESGRVGRAVSSVVSNGVIVSGGLVRESVLSPGVRVDDWASVERAVVLHNARIGRRAVVRDAILDKNVVVTEGAAVGVDKERDRRTRVHGVPGRDHRGRQGPRGGAVAGGAEQGRRQHHYVTVPSGSVPGSDLLDRTKVSPAPA